jgi:peptidoglycan/LPS O-acetylase OafA/YrhL
MPSATQPAAVFAPAVPAVAARESQPHTGFLLPTANTHFPTLDGVRGVAVLLVVLYHYVKLLDPQRLGTVVLHRATALGWGGVDLFFVLSGFLITGILLDAKGAAGYFRNFYARRVLRIFPLYYAVLVVAVALAAWRRDTGAGWDNLWTHQAYLWLYLSNVGTVLTGLAFNTDWLWLGHFWSLAVEEHFYLAWPAVVLLCSRRWLLRLTLALVVLAPLSRLLGRCWLSTDALYLLTPFRVDGLAAGAFLAVWLRGRPRLPVWAPRCVLLCCLAALAVIGLWRRDLSHHDGVIQGVGHSLIALASCCLIVEALYPPGWCTLLLGNAALRFLGRCSYGLYVYHGLFRLLYFELFRRLEAWSGSYPLAAALWLPASIGVSILVAWLSYRWFEQPILRLKRFFPYRQPARPVLEPGC